MLLIQVLTVSLAVDLSVVALWHAGPRKYSPQRRWARRLASLNNVLIRIILIAFIPNLLRCTETTMTPTPLQELWRAATTLSGVGISTIPVQGKKPTLATWSECQKTIPSPELLDIWYGKREPTPEEATLWYPNGWRKPTGLAVVCGYVSHGNYETGGTQLIDADRLSQIDPFEERAGKALDNVHVRETGSGKRHYVFISDEVGGNTKLARYQDGSEVRVSFETRGDHGYFVAVGSHPETQQPYRPLRGSLKDLKRISMDQALTLLEVARSFNEVEDATRVYTDENNDERPSEVRLIIHRWRERHPIRDTLELYGYTRVSDWRFKRPGGKSSSVVISSDELISKHYSSNDDMARFLNAEGLPYHDSFDHFMYFEHGGDFSVALRAAAQEIGVPFYHRSDESGLSVTFYQVVAGDAVTLLDYDSDMIVVCDSEIAARTIHAMGCAAAYGPLGGMWPESCINQILAFPHRYVWYSMDYRALAERLSFRVKGKLIGHERTPDELVHGYGAGSLEIAGILRTGRELQWRMGARAALKGKLH